jgi:hypothetical protein
MLVIATMSQASDDPFMADMNKKIEALKAESKAKVDAAKVVQIARFKAHPEQLDDLKRCDWDKFDGNHDEKWISTIACNEVSGLQAQRERIRAEWHTIECTNIKNCQLTISMLREGIASIRRQRADAKLFAEDKSFGFKLMPEPYSPCGITPLACGITHPELSEAFSEVEQYYRKLLRESDKRLNEARELLEKKKQQDNYEDQLLDSIDR